MFVGKNAWLSFCEDCVFLTLDHVQTVNGLQHPIPALAAVWNELAKLASRENLGNIIHQQ